jgi:hypothetical protein
MKVESNSSGAPNATNSANAVPLAGSFDFQFSTFH